MNSLLTVRDQVPIPSPSEIHIMLGSFSCSFLKDMKNIDRFCKLGDIADPMLYRGMNPNLPYSRSNARHRLPVEWFQPR
jgi:hypothetical protein